MRALFCGATIVALVRCREAAWQIFTAQRNLTRFCVCVCFQHLFYATIILIYILILSDNKVIGWTVYE